MKPYIACLFNGAVLFSIGMVGYINTRSLTALIPPAIGVLLFALIPLIRRGNRYAAHTAVFFTALVLVGLIKPLTSAIGDGDTSGLIRVSLMLFSSFVAIIIFVKSFVDARKNTDNTI